MSWRRWMLILSFFLMYLLFGGGVLMLLETPGETERTEELRQFQRVIYEELIACGVNQTEKELNSREEIWIRVAEFIGIPALVRDGSAPVKKWTLFNSFFVALTAASTIGYGHLAPTSTGGRIFCMAFALIGIPLNGILFATLGDFFGSKLIRRSKKRTAIEKPTGFLVVMADAIFYLVPGMVVFLAVPAGLFSIMEKWTYLDSFYYAFISLTTIGFGDFVAGQNYVGNLTWLYRCVIVIWIFFGLGYLVMVINIITKGLRSKPVVALEKKVAAQLRSTKQALAKDALLLRQLVNQIRVLKIKPVYKVDKSEVYDIRRVGSQPNGFHDEDKDDSAVQLTSFRPGMKVFSTSDTALASIDVDATFQQNSIPVHTTQDPMSLNVDFDPVQLLTRLASALCDDDDSSSVISFHDDTIPNDGDSVVQMELGLESNKSPRSSSVRRSDRSLSALLNMDGDSKKPEIVGSQYRQEQLMRRSLRNSRRVRRLSETLHKPVAWSFSDSKTPKPQRRITVEEEPGRRLEEDGKIGRRPVYQRSVSESYSQAISRFDPRQLKTEASASNNRDSEAAPAVNPPLSVVEFCDLLDRVQISGPNSSALPQ